MKICIEVFKHEIKKILSEPKLLMSVFIMPTIMVLVTSFISSAQTQSDFRQNECYIYVLDNMLEQQISEGVTIIPVSYTNIDALLAEVELTASDVILEIKDSESVVYYNSANAISQNLSYACEQLLTRALLNDFAAIYKVDISARLEVIDVNREKGTVNNLMAMILPYTLILILFQDTANYAIDTIAGEKERGIFGKTLLAPIPPAAVIVGKLLSSTVCGIFSSAVYVFIVVVSSGITGIDIWGLKKSNITLTMAGLLIVCALLLSYFFANLAVLCSLYSKTVKEAQAMKLPVYGITMVLALLSIVRSGTVPLLCYLIPVYNICIVMQDILSSTIEIQKILITVLSLLLCSWVVVFVTVKSFNKESIRQ